MVMYAKVYIQFSILYFQFYTSFYLFLKNICMKCYDFDMTKVLKILLHKAIKDV